MNTRLPMSRLLISRFMTSLAQGWKLQWLLAPMSLLALIALTMLIISAMKPVPIPSNQSLMLATVQINTVHIDPAKNHTKPTPDSPHSAPSTADPRRNPESHSLKPSTQATTWATAGTPDQSAPATAAAGFTSLRQSLEETSPPVVPQLAPPAE